MTRYAFKLPDLGEGTVEAELLGWHVQVGEVIRPDQILAEVMTEKAAVELPSPVAGRVVRLAGAPGEIIKVGAVLIELETPDDAAPAAPAASAASAASAVAPGPAGPRAPTGPAALVASMAPGSPLERVARAKASPATRRRAHEAGIDLQTLSGSGPRGIVTAADVAAAAKPAAIGADTRPGTDARAGADARADVEEIPVTGLRRAIAQRMTESKRTIPHFGYVEEVDVTELEALRAHLNSRRPDSAPPLSYLPFIIIGLVRALQRFPQCNAVFDTGRNVIVRHRNIHVGIATQAPDGLVVPVLRDAQGLSVEQIAARIRELAERARGRRLNRDELSGSTITVSSLGKLGGVSSTPVINAPEVAIVGVNKVRDTVRWIDGAFVVRKTMNLSSAFDHRCVDGYDAASMIQELRMMLEHPATLFIR